MISRAVVTGGAVAWLGLLLAAPWLPTVMAAALYAAASVLCHQIPERSLYLGGAQLPVCARCLGIYAGLAAGVVVWFGSVADGDRVARMPVARWFAVAAAPTVATVLLETAGVLRTTNLERLLAGVVLGVGGAAVVMWAVATLHYERCQQQVRGQTGVS